MLMIGAPVRVQHDAGLGKDIERGGEKLQNSADTSQAGSNDVSYRKGARHELGTHRGQLCGN